VLGDSPGQTDSWTGQFLGFAVYNRELTPQQLLKHYQSWTQAGRPEIRNAEGNVALYLFDERAGNIVHNRVNSGVDLSIPEKYVVLDQIFLEPFWKEFTMSGVIGAPLSEHSSDLFLWFLLLRSVVRGTPGQAGGTNGRFPRRAGQSHY